MPLADVRTEEYGAGLRLIMTFESSAVVIEKSVVCYPDVAILEQWLTARSREADLHPVIDAPQLFSWSSPASQLEWLRGLDQPSDVGGSFTIEQREVFPDERVELRAYERSTETAWPWSVLRTESDAMISGILWSGAWAIDIEGWERGTRVRAGLPNFSTTLSSDRPFESPRVFFGLTGADASQVGRAMRRYVDVAIREGRPIWPLTTYNTWFSHGIAIDEESTLRAVRQAGELGVELFELDAGWYPRPSGTRLFDFTAGLGSWTVDAARFPSGLRWLGNQMRARGMKFGLWVEPERVDLSTVGRPGGAEEAWLVRANGRTQPSSGEPDGRGAMICLAHPDARAWMFNHVAALIDREGVDYLKWDNNAWLSCDREGHGHGPRDGNYAQVRGLYEVLAELRRRFPQLLIENVSGGGHRIDLEMLRYTDAGWMDDRTSPSTHVRHNLEGLSRALPLAYLLSYTMAHESEPLHDAADTRWLVRSRMPGVLGFSYRTEELSESDVNALSGEVALYKRLRETLADAHAVLVTPQVPQGHAQSPDVIQAVSPSTGRSVVFAYRNAAKGPFRVRLQGLSAETAYQVESADRGLVGTFPGATLSEVGIEIDPAAGPSAAQALLLTPTGR
jgi:alpha-galactosidase